MKKLIFILVFSFLFVSVESVSANGWVGQQFHELHIKVKKVCKKRKYHKQQKQNKQEQISFRK